jgi:Spy/CpxP family protein refolding chaperone
MKRMKLAIAAAVVLATCAWMAQSTPAEETPAKVPAKGNISCKWAAGNKMNMDTHMADMAACLGLSDEQKTKIKPILDEHYKEKQAIWADKTLSRDQRQAKMQELRGKIHDKITPILTAEQNKKAADMWTTAGKRHHGRKGCQKPRHHGKTHRISPNEHLAKMTSCLGLSDEQQEKIKPILDEQYKQKQAVRADKKLTRDQRQAKMQELRVQLHDQVKPILTPEQLKQFDAQKNYQAKKSTRSNCPYMK